MHRQFVHALRENRFKLVKESKGFNDKEFLKSIEEFCDKCQIYRRHKRHFQSPVVSIPIASQLNKVICLDLKEYKHNKIWILHLTDAATRYLVACLVRRKNKSKIIKQIYRIWIVYFGSPNLFLCDNGGEFSNDLFQEINEKVNVETRMPAGESPFSNGIVERHNKVFFEAFSKTLEDVPCEPEVALVWAPCAKNGLQNSGGLTPNQLVFEHIIITPSVLTEKLPAFQPKTSSKIEKI